MSAPFDPYRQWLGIPSEEQPPNHYRLLAITLFEGDPQVIQAAAERQIVCISGHRLGQWSAVAQRLLNELSAAKISLLQPETKATYDAELREQLASGRMDFALPAEDSLGFGILPEQLAAPAAKSPPVIPPPVSIAPAQPPVTAPPIVEPGPISDWPATIAVGPPASGMAPAWPGARTEGRSFHLNGILLVVLVSAAAAIVGAAFLAVVLRQIDQSRELAADATAQDSQPAEVSTEAVDDNPASGDTENTAPTAPRRKLPADTRTELDTAEFETPTDDDPAAMPGTGAMPGENDDDARPAGPELPPVYREDGVILHVAVSPDGQEAVSIAQLRRAPLPNSIRFWNMEDGTQIPRELKLPFDATIARYSSSGRELLLGTSSGKATVISLETGETLALGRGQGPVSTAIATGNDAFLFVRPNQLVIEGWDRGHNVLRVACESLKAWPASLALSADNTTLLTGSPPRKMPNARGPEPRAPDKKPANKKPADKNAADVAAPGAGAATLQLWQILATPAPDAANQSVYRAALALDLSNQLAGLSCAVLAADGRRILFAGSDGDIHVWDVERSAESRKLSGHAGIVTSMSLSSDGSRLISGSEDRSVRAWAVPEGIGLMRYDGHAGSVRSVAIAPDGRTAISGADDGQVRIWRLPIARTAVAANPRDKNPAGRNAVAKKPAGQPQPAAIFEPAIAVAPAAKVVAAEPPALAPPPAGSALQRALADVKKLFRLEFAAAKDADGRVELAGMLLNESGSYPLPYRFAMLDEARNLAISSGNLGLAQNAIRLLAEQFDIDTAQATAEMLEQLSHQPLTTETRQGLAAASLMAAEELLASEKYAAARKLLAIAVASVRKTNDARLSAQIVDRTAEAAELQKLFDRFSAGQKTLAGQSDDAAAHLAVGRYLCFVRQDWAAGFPHLAAGDNAGLQEVARLELAGSPRPADMVKLADAWWKLGQTAKGKERADFVARSRHWYQKALPELAGLTETRVAQRLAELEAQDIARARGR